MGSSQPFTYAGQQRNDARFPTTTFDPKAVTRASWEPKPQKPRPQGPLVSFNRHPDAHLIPPHHRTGQYAPLGWRTKSGIKWLRRFQLLVRVLQLNGAAGVLVLFSLFTNIDGTTSWAMRILQAVTIAHCVYAAYHLSRDAAGRTPASSAAYQFSAVILDLAAMANYIFGALTVHESASSWGTLLNDQSLMTLFVPAVYYTMIGAGGLHLVSLSTSLWLGWVFRKISSMPPDMNPLEDHLTARPLHKRNRSSVSTTTSTVAETEGRPTAYNKARRDSAWSCDEVPPPTRISFMHTRTQSRDSVGSAMDSQVNLPSRQYQIVPGNSPRNSISPTRVKPRALPQPPSRGSTYTEVPTRESNVPEPDPAPGNVDGGRAAKFTETWMPTASLISRTNQRYQAMATVGGGHRAQGSKSYSALTEPYNLDQYSSDSEYEEEQVANRAVPYGGRSRGSHPNPLRSNPTSTPDKSVPQTKRPLRPWSSSKGQDYDALFEMTANERHASVSRDIADEPLQPEDAEPQHLRNSSIQSENFYSRPYDEPRSASPPILVGSSRKVSSGNDYASKYSSFAYERRNVSGKIVEEGRAASRYPAGPIR